MPPSLSEAAYRHTRAFHALPEGRKQRYHHSLDRNGRRGWPRPLSGCPQIPPRLTGPATRTGPACYSLLARTRNSLHEGTHVDCKCNTWQLIRQQTTPFGRTSPPPSIRCGVPAASCILLYPGGVRMPPQNPPSRHRGTFDPHLMRLDSIRSDRLGWIWFLCPCVLRPHSTRRDPIRSDPLDWIGSVYPLRGAPRDEAGCPCAIRSDPIRSIGLE